MPAPSSASARAAGDPHFLALDGLRGAAVSLVIGFHAAKAFPATDAASRAYGELASAGWAGVDLFFVLSGFLITGILVRAKGSPDYFSAFYVRRTLRIFPLYYGALVLLLAVLPALRLIDAPFPGDLERSLSGWVWIYGLNLQIAYTEAWTAAPDYLNHFWSLAVEEQFYLLWPFLVWFTPRRRLRVLCGAAILFGVAYRGLLVSRGQLNAALVLMPCRVDTLALGGLLAVLFHERGELPASVRRLSPPLGLGAFVGLLVLREQRGHLHALDPWVASLGFLLYGVFFTAALARALRAGSWLARVLEHRALRETGKVSYALYVFHQPIVVWLAAKGVPAVLAARLGGLPGEVCFLALVLAASMALAQLSWSCLERPLLGLKRRFPYAPA